MKWKLRKTHKIVPVLVHNVRGVKQVRCRDNAFRPRGWFWMAGPVKPTHRADSKLCLVIERLESLIRHALCTAIYFRSSAYSPAHDQKLDFV